MKIALLGFGKMGREIAACGVEVVPPEEADVLIDFSHRDALLRHIDLACALGKNLVIGTTGWHDLEETARKKVLEGGIGVVYGANFSLSVNLFLKLVAYARKLVAPFSEYDLAGVEIHHREKKDHPSGTALKMGIPFESVRVGQVPGTHMVMVEGPCDGIELRHTARSRRGFAEGALLAATWIMGKKGWYPYESCLETHYSPDHSL